MPRMPRQLERLPEAEAELMSGQRVSTPGWALVARGSQMRLLGHGRR